MNKRDMAVDLLGAFGKFMPDAPTQPYYIRLNGKFFCSHDTAELVDQVTAYFNKSELVDLVSLIVREG